MRSLSRHMKCYFCRFCELFEAAWGAAFFLKLRGEASSQRKGEVSGFSWSRLKLSECPYQSIGNLLIAAVVFYLFLASTSNSIFKFNFFVWRMNQLEEMNKLKGSLLF